MLHGHFYLFQKIWQHIRLDFQNKDFLQMDLIVKYNAV